MVASARDRAGRNSDRANNWAHGFTQEAEVMDMGTTETKGNVPARSAQQDVGMPTWWDRFWAWPNFPQMRRFFEEDDMRVEEFVDDDKLVVRAELPGIDPERDVEINVRDHSLRIRAERHQEHREDEGGRYHSEFHYGTFTRIVPLSSSVSETDVKASYRDGILEVRVPIDEKDATAKKIPIERG
jgi:HSP20 family protein